MERTPHRWYLEGGGGGLTASTAATAILSLGNIHLKAMGGQGLFTLVVHGVHTR